MRKSIYLLRDEALSSGRSVFSYAQLSKLFRIKQGEAKVYASRLIARGFATRAIEGRISFTDDRFVIATQLVEPSYISFTSALYLREIILQVPAVVECVTPVISNRLPALGIEYHKIDPILFFGYERVSRGNNYVFLASPEKALLDMVYFSKIYDRAYGESFQYINFEQLAEYAGKFAGTRRGKKVMEWVRNHAK
ncbi:MAG: hypothetical protein JRN10_02985 [Nitrososphaerota archaeon]|jgi:predicted transcriptional regulator of viral defense system|nr:hypothetical protein [Nitrososphaerota archaeon]MDG6930192.1 hypothetical protein [Nitrososphaerota archaeon]MDG6932421.1 hypothetical protein [Nitrososphaerota archaeon]